MAGQPDIYDPSFDEELEAAGLEIADLIPKSRSAGMEVEPSETVAGWELSRNEGDFISSGGQN